MGIPRQLEAAPFSGLNQFCGPKRQPCPRSVPPPPSPLPLLPPPPCQWQKAGCETVKPASNQESAAYNQFRATSQKL
jgi:hypothetical protein